MRITNFNSAFPPQHIAKAYGLNKTAPVSPSKPAELNSPMAFPTTSASAPTAQNLIAARVDAPVNFDAASQPSRANHAFQMYTRAADKIEAAVAVQVGRVIDLKG